MFYVYSHLQMNLLRGLGFMYRLMSVFRQMHISDNCRHFYTVKNIFNVFIL